jgi:hypothetical protein
VIGKVMRGRKVAGLLRYLYGPGRSNEHTNAHLVASWDDDPARLVPAMLPGGRPDVQHLAHLLEQPLAAAVRAPDRPVWHCAVRTAPADRSLTDAEWRTVARDIVGRTGLAPDGDDGGCRWVAVRHADDHIHLVVTLARQDGAPAKNSNDFYRVGEACRAAETRLGLTGTAARDRTAARRPTRGETEKATRAGRREPARATLQREVRTAAAGAATAEEFLSRLADAGLLVRPRLSENNPSVITGYAVALPHDRTGRGSPVWFGGGRLAADLSWPKLATRWQTGNASAGRATEDQAASSEPAWRPGHETATRLTGLDRARAWQDAARASAAAAHDVARLADVDPAAASDIAHATGRLLASTARAMEGRRGGPLTAAADTYDRAARDLYGRPPHRQPAGDSLRAVARLVALTGRAARDETTQVLALVANLAALAEAVAQLRQAQQRLAQASAARTAADQLRALAPPPAPAAPPSQRHVAAAVVHSHPLSLPIHRSPVAPATAPAHRRRVTP